MVGFRAWPRTGWPDGSDEMKDDRYWHCLDQAMEASHGGHTDEAMAWLDEALKENPNGAEAHNGRGEILWDDTRIDEALYEFELATLADPKFATAHLNRAELLIEELGEYEEALQLCDRLLGGAAELPRLDRTLEAEIHYLKSKACFYQEDLEGALFLVRREDQALLGAITLDNIRRGPAQAGTLGYWVGAPHARQGYMREAILALVHHAFTKMDLSRIEAACLPENHASRGLLESAGFKYEGVAQSYLQINGRWRTHVLYAALRIDRRGKTDAGL